MVEPAPVSTLLPSLRAARPPTPPRESSHSEPKSTSLIGRFFQKESSSRRSSNTSNFTPESSAESPSQSAGVSRKKVGFAEWTDYKEPPQVSFDGKGDIKHAVQRLPPSAERKPSKSILKPFNGAHEDDHSNLGSNTKLLPPHHHATFATMLESIVQQLAGKDRSSKQDAYLMLSGSLKASDNVPDMRALKEKMPLLCQFVLRDLSEKLDNGHTDSTLVTKALVLLSSFLQKPAIAETFPAEFPMHIVDHAIKTLEDGSASKDIVKHLMFVLAQQNFSPKIMSQERTGRLIIALHDIEKHMKGKSIIMGRLDIYRSLLRQSKSHMISNTGWVVDLFTDMLSSIREIRTPAITFGLEASMILGREGNVSRAVSNLFKIEQIEQVDGQTFADYYAARLRDMVKDKDVSSTVPQIWSVIVLFLRYKSQLLEQWKFLPLFLNVIQDCFNSSDPTTKLEANYAWNRFVFAILPNEKTIPNMRSMLSKPLMGQLQRSKSSSTSGRKAALSSVCNLLYYSLKPNSPPARLDMYWDEYVVSLVGQCLVAGVRTKDAADACSILQGLFDSTTLRTWTENRAMDNLQQNSMEPKDLPALDSKWLRRSFSHVFPVLGPLLERLYWELGEESDVSKLWETYIASIASPMRMEVKVSMEAMGCVASLFSLLHRIWNVGPRGVGFSLPSNEAPLPQSTSAFLRSFDKLVSTAIKGLGLLAFTEKLLCITQDTFVAIATPSGHPKKPRGVTKSPLHHLVLLLVSISPSLEYDQRFSHMVHHILLPFVESRATSKSRLEFVKGLLPLLPAESTAPCRLIWQILADFATVATDTRDNKDANRSNEQPLGADYHDVIRILEFGIKISPHQPLPGWKKLFGALAASATIDAGDAGRAIAVIEPLAKSLLPTAARAGTTVTGLSYLHLILGKSAYPKDQQALDAAKRRMWGAENAGPKILTFDPYVKLYECIQTSLVSTYDALSKQAHHDYADVISSVTSLLGRCPAQLLLNALAKVQNGIACWIVDDGRKLHGGTVLSQSVINLWSAVTKILPSLQTLHSHTKILSDLEHLISSGLESKHKTIVNKTIQLWNSMFGDCEDGLIYPELVRAALLRLRSIADINLPFFPESLESEPLIDQRQPTDFVESQDESTNYSGFSSLESAIKKNLEPHIDPLAIRKPRQSTPLVIIEVGRTQSRKRSREVTPESSNRKSRKRDVTPRLRHDDSQVQFEAIESSPMADRVADSQLLTEKQKEVKERQQAEAAMFPDLRSSPIPKAKSVERSVPDPELPVHRSSSKIRAKLSPTVARQTTPTLIFPSDDDKFVPSSPTPTRSLRGEADTSGPPSSPPEAVTKTTLEYEENIALSPPEVMSEPGDDDAVSLDPSAQIDPYAVEINRTMSTFESTPADGGSCPIDPSGQLEATEAEQLLRAAAIEDGTDERRAEQPIEQPIEQPNEADVEPTMEPNTGPELPGTPSQSGSESLAAQQTPKTPQFVDALSSPASSDKLTVNEDVFEDAVSSPRLNLVNTDPKQSSSLISDGDDSSMLRLVAEYDQGSGRARRHISFLEDKENQPRRTRASSAKDTASPGIASGRKPALRIQSLPQSEDKGLESISEIQKLSSDPSLIPETPAAKPNEASTKVIIDGEEIDWETTIIVDTSSLENGDDPPTIKRGTPRKSLLTYSKKRKHHFIDEDTGDVPDSQAAKASVERTSPKNISSSKKKRKGRPRKASQIQQIETDAEVEQSQSPSVDLDAAMQNVEIEDCTTNAFTSSAKDTTVDEGVDTEEPQDESHEILPAADGISEAAEDTSMAATTEEDFNIAQTTDESIDEAADTSVASEVRPASPNIEMVEETVIDESAFQDESSSTPEPVESKLNPAAEIISATSSDLINSLTAEPAEKHVSVESTDKAEPEFPTVQSMKDKLQSLITDMQGAALSREELREFEDLFVDAKEQLYGAGRRGRERNVLGT